MRSAHLLTNRERLLALGILILALAVRLWDIRARALWFDEASEYWIATAPLSQLVVSARTGSGDPPLFTFLLHAWMQLGTSEMWLRLLSVLGSVSGVAGVMVLARRLGGSTVALCAGLLMAVLPADVRYAQEVGQYGMVPAVVAWNLVFLFDMMQERRWRSILGWTLTALAGAYLYYGTVIPIAACFLCVVFESVARRDMRTRRATGTALVLCVMGLVPLFISYLPTQLSRVLESGGVGTSPATTGGGLIGFLHRKWTLMSELLAFQFTGWPHTHIPSGVVVVPVVVLMVLAARRAPRLVVWLVTTSVAYGVLNALGLFPIGYRWGMIMTPLIICAIATSLAAVLATRAKWATIAVFAALLALCAVSLPNRALRDRVYRDETGSWPETEDMRVVTDYWLEHRETQQPTYVYYGAAPAFAYYTREAIPREDLPSTWHFACWHDPYPPGFCMRDGIYYGHWIRRLGPPDKIVSVLSTMGGRPESFWIVFGHLVPGDDREMITGFKREGYRLDAAVEAVNASACLLVRER